MTARSLAALVVSLLMARPAIADPSPESAESLFVRARALMKTGECERALPLLQQSHAIEPTLGTHLNMAICEVRLGRLIQARDHLRLVVNTSRPDDERRVHAERALGEILPRIPQVVLEIDDTRHEIESIRLDGEPLFELRSGEPFGVNPGSHELEVVLAGEGARLRRFNVAERQVYTWALGGTNRSVSVVTTPPSTFGDRNTLSNHAGTESEDFVWTTRRTAAVVAAGTSLAAFAVGTGLAFSARSVYDSADCNGDVCQSDGIATRDDARQRGSIATVAFTVGVASAFAAGTLWLTGTPRSRNPANGPQLGIRWEANPWPGGGIVVQGSY